MTRDKYKQKREKRGLRHRRVRSRVVGNVARPRLAVFRSSQHIYAQVIDDTSGKTLISVSDLDIERGKKSEKALEVGKRLGKKAVEMGVKEVSFDRGGFKYHGRVKALAEGAGEAGLEF